jgi:hypothetical protein
MRAFFAIALSASAVHAAPQIGVAYSHEAHAELASAPSVPIARYGVQRTSRGKAVWRDSGCVAVEYDGATIDPAMAKVMDAAFASWESGVATCGELAITTTRVAHAPVGIDGISTIRVRADVWPYSPDAAAVTRIAFVDDPSSPNDGRIVEADMEINAVDYKFLAPGAAATDGLYLQAVVTHEIGHMLGLAHACGTGAEDWPTDHANQAVPACDAPEVQAATMFVAINPVDDGPSSLEANDIAGACAIFRDVACVAEVQGGCRATRSTSAWLGLLLIRLRRRRKA